MAITINGSGTITGISTGGLPDGIVDDGTLATSAVTSTKIADGTITNADINASAGIVGSKINGSFGKVLQVAFNNTALKTGGWTDTNTHDMINLTFTPLSATSTLYIEAMNSGQIYGRAVTDQAAWDSKVLDGSTILQTSNYHDNYHSSTSWHAIRETHHSLSVASSSTTARTYKLTIAISTTTAIRYHEGATNGVPFIRVTEVEA